MLKLIIVSLFLLAASGCATLPEQAVRRGAGVDGVACVGAIAGTPEALAQDTNAALLAQAQFPSGKGGTCDAEVFSVTAPLVLYRVFDSSRPYSKFGGWWALDRPAGTRDSYRATFAICPEWSQLDRVVSCEVRPGTQLVLGTTQSAICADGSVLPKTGAIQVYVPNNGKAGIYHVGACAEEHVWP